MEKYNSSLSTYTNLNFMNSPGPEGYNFEASDKLIIRNKL